MLLPERESLSRRDWMARIVQTMGASALVLPVAAQDHASMASPMNATAWRPVFLTSEQNEGLVSLGECIVPGSAAAGCNRVIDLVLSIETDKAKQEMSSALAAFDREAQRKHRKVFSRLPPEQRTAVLSVASEEGQALHGEFGVVKEWIADAYWSSEQGMRELGWDGRVAWASFGGCPHEGAHPSGNA